MKSTRVLLVFGTRPEAIKMAPLVRELAVRESFDARVAVTAQHREMLDQVLELFAIRADYDLDIMKEGQSLSGIMQRALAGLEDIIADFLPHLVLVHGDTATTLAGALAAFYKQIPIGHVEAGLRTNDKYKPFPEEMNRHLTGVLADFHFAPTEEAAKNLLKENIPSEKVVVTGNTVIDALLIMVAKDHSFAGSPLEDIDFSAGPTVLLTAHRRENWGKPLEEIAEAVLELTEDVSDLQVICPLHPNEKVRGALKPVLGGKPRIHLIEPLDYLSFCHLMNKVTFILSDSGGIQEEAPALGKPVLLLRDKTERPEAVAAGTVKLVGCKKQKIYDTARRLLKDHSFYEAMAKAQNPYGDGKASSRIVDFLTGINYLAQ